jgi:hypothetical protein
MTGDVTVPLLPCAAVDPAEAALAELLAMPLTDTEREQLTDLLPGSDARGLGAEQ